MLTTIKGLQNPQRWRRGAAARCRHGHGASVVAVPAWSRCRRGGSGRQELEQLQSGVTPLRVPTSLGASPCQEGPHTSRARGEPLGAGCCSREHRAPAPQGHPAPCLSFPRRRQPGLRQPPGTEPPRRPRGPAPHPQTAHIPPPHRLFLRFPFSLPILHPLAPSHAPGPGVPVPP